MSAANTLTFAQIQFGVGLFQGVAAVVHRLEWFLPLAQLTEIAAGTDEVELALCNRDDLANLDPDNQSVLSKKALTGITTGAVVSEWIQEQPLVNEFSDMPGGGLIIPANPIYVGMDTVGFAAAGICDLVFYLTFRQLTDAEYVELIQTIMPANI